MKFLHTAALVFFAVLCSCSTAAAQSKFSVLGDSYSTFGGYVSPESNWCWYNGSDGGDNKKTDVTAVGQTWWRILAEDCGLSLERNNSFSGATVCCTGYGGNDYSDRAFLTRMVNLGNPDIIIVFGGTNDSWAGAPLGSFRYSGWTKEDLYSFRPAFAYMIHNLQQLYPGALIINVTNSELSDGVTESMDTICGHYGVANVKLHDIDKLSGHPSVAGMRAIADQIKPLVPEH